MLQAAKSAVEVIVRDLKNLFKKNYERNRQYPTSTLVPELESANYAPIPHQIAFGLFLVKEIPGIIMPQFNAQNTEVLSFRINEHILTQNPEKVWDEYVRSQIPNEEARTTLNSAQQQTPKVALKKTSDWPPAPWKIVESLGEGGQGWTYKVRRSGDPDHKVYVLKRLKNKERLSRFKSEICSVNETAAPRNS